MEILTVYLPHANSYPFINYFYSRVPKEAESENPAKTNIIGFLSFSLERGKTNKEQINVGEQKFILKCKSQL